ncbi:OmpG family monomeric porin [Providencia stuartii]|uniref:OmpG family monomeric porin n=2 Tax=Morganellaceae TaxID=1903414 RepID=A0ABD5LDI2_PROST|nr:OmpG family monomeric porin [Providencia sp. PROV133]ELR5044071.1 OmpG family monomeric porin [Providencia rettgeri]ELR5292979.1 OmpG family monomeric porin [Providencia stuartii]MCR4181962.1 OmpG family monomeric porin [Providencia vermicola]URE78537.1 OmpG family monomeric porin [Providencia stuartii]
MIMEYFKGLILSTVIILPTTAFSQASNDYWHVDTDVYVEVEEYQGQRDSFNNKVFDKVSMVGKLALTNPQSLWGFYFEHRESLKNYGHDFSSSRDSSIRNRTQIGATRQLYQSAVAAFSLNGSYRKESNDSAPNTTALSSNSLYWLMPAGSIQINKKWSFDFWDALYYYSNFLASNYYEWEAEHGVTYKHSNAVTAKFTLYNDRVWDKDFNQVFARDQIRGYFPIKISEKWAITPYFRYFLNDSSYDSQKNLTQRIKNGYRIGTQIAYNVTPKLTLWGGAAIEATQWKYPINNHMTSGRSHSQTYYLGQIGIKYSWQ